MIPSHTLLIAQQQKEALENLSCLTKKLFSWFTNNQMIANNDKCHLMLSSPEENAAIQIEESRIKRSKVKKLLGIHIDYKVKFNTGVDSICKTIHRKLIAVFRIVNYMALPKRRILMSAFF